ncbi:hypothetical protein ACIA7S_28675 [Streptomyces sp. NPDC051643]|uniref:hypothetical protein n=1 Tax=Streptomyces sp. NPDC051643 TaxID=3365665 RepID=UPI0037B23636
MNWADTAITGGPRTLQFWPAAPVILIAVAYLWVVHPRRSLANVRSWKAEEQSQE